MRETESFGYWLRQRRKALGLTQEDLAERMSCSISMIRKLEAGQRVASQEMADLLVDLLEVAANERAAFVQFAKGRLTGYAGKRKLWQTLHSHTAQPHLTNILAPLTELIGREQELKSLSEHLLLRHGRLCTLTGPPGIGKTSLGIEAGIRLLDHFEDGVFFVSLAPIRDPEMVPATVAQVLGAFDAGSLPLTEQLVQFLHEKHLLLVLDNFEQVLDASPFVLKLLGVCPHLKVLTTSREALHVHGEQQFPVPSLATAALDNLPPLEAMESIPAIALFVERARAVTPSFALTEENARAVAAICARLDGLPLAIELAAARVKLLSPHEIRSRLENPDSGQNFAMLKSGARNLPPRQRTLHHAIEWSYNLLTEEEQRLFARLSVFAGGGTFPAIEVICNAREGLRIEVLDGIDSLVSKNLLKQDDTVAGASRYRMLEMIREYASGRLAASAEEADVRRLHAEYYLAIAEAADQEWRGSGKQKLWLDRLRHERDNIGSALKWLLGTHRTTLALRLAGAMDYFWYTDGQHREGRRWLEAALAAANDAPPRVRARALRALGHLAQQEDDNMRSVAPLEESLALYRELGDTTAIAGLLRILAFSAIRRGDVERGIALCNEGLSLGPDPSLRYETVALLYTMGAAMWHQGDLARAEEFILKSLELNLEEGNEDMLTSDLDALGVIATSRGDYNRAEQYHNESLVIARRIGDQRAIAQLTTNLAGIALSKGDAASAAPLLSEGFNIMVEMSDREGIAQGLECTATLSHLLGQQDRAVRLFAAADALRKAAHFPLPGHWGAAREGVVSAIRCEMPNETFTKLWEQGHSMRMQEAITYAFEGD